MGAEEIDAAAAAAELNILGGLASVTGLQSPAPTRPAGATANDASKDEASPIPSAPAAPQGAVPATPSAVLLAAGCPAGLDSKATRHLLLHNAHAPVHHQPGQHVFRLPYSAFSCRLSPPMSTAHF